MTRRQSGKFEIVNILYYYAGIRGCLISEAVKMAEFIDLDGRGKELVLESKT